MRRSPSRWRTGATGRLLRSCTSPTQMVESLARRRLSPGAMIGILGGGQLARMLTMAAAQLGLRCHIYCPDPDSPAFKVAGLRTLAAYDDETALAAFARSVDVVTYEFENVPAAAAVLL